ncbi:hypothetical protein KVR01_004516 [Diaporthe batatas]|uniref:uncharacterized protein n=1 Tax=Diaporthe batatas TaxID=748121 RepID=UPI001D03A234|nr:uncharacterized protein KVR01_004516 [Diaporthe batatas]KAG8165964.1 hypothetical protein KVR01_004516 [Diaporthe batatas]
MSQPKKYTTLPTTHKYMELHVDNVISQWAEQNLSRIISAHRQKGGWEGWAQVEIATALQESTRRGHQPSSNSSSSPATTTTLAGEASREVDVYHATGQLADIVIASRARRQFVIIELKCEGFHGRDFARGVAGDIAKLRGDIKDKFKPARAWALAISTSSREYARMRRLWPTAKHKVLYDPGQGGSWWSGRGQSMDPKIVLWVFQREVVKL